MENIFANCTSSRLLLEICWKFVAWILNTAWLQMLTEWFPMTNNLWIKLGKYSRIVFVIPYYFVPFIRPGFCTTAKSTAYWQAWCIAVRDMHAFLWKLRTVFTPCWKWDDVLQSPQNKFNLTRKVLPEWFSKMTAWLKHIENLSHKRLRSRENWPSTMRGAWNAWLIWLIDSLPATV